MKFGEKYVSKMNWTYWIMVVFMVLCLMPSTVMAHTGLDKSTPKNGDIIKEDLKKITMIFESKVEKLSSFKVYDENNQTVDISPPSFDGKTMEGLLKEPLPNGSFTVKWNIMGTDGHPIKGEFSFKVDKPMVEQLKTEIPTPTIAPSIAPSPSEDNISQSDIQSEEDNLPSPVAKDESWNIKIIFMAIGGLLLSALLIFSAIRVMKQGKKN